MRMNWLFLLVLPVGLAAQSAGVCNPTVLVGPYAFQLTGSTNISGTPQPAASLGRIVFDGSGGLSGTASASLSDRPGGHGGRAIHFGRKVRCRTGSKKVHFLLVVSAI